MTLWSEIASYASYFGALLFGRCC